MGRRVLWDHVLYRPPVTAVADPWITLAAIATATEQVRIGPIVTPLARRRPQIVARQCTSLDQLSGGRMVLGAGLGLDSSGGELSRFGEELDDRRRAAMLDEALGLLDALWSGDEVHHTGEHYRADGVRFLPRPVQRPRIPVAGRSLPQPRANRPAARFEGAFPIDLDSADQLAEIIEILRTERGEAGLEGFDIVVEGDNGSDPAPFAAAGATWWLAAFDAFTVDAATVRESSTPAPRSARRPAPEVLEVAAGRGAALALVLRAGGRRAVGMVGRSRHRRKLIWPMRIRGTA